MFKHKPANVDLQLVIFVHIDYARSEKQVNMVISARDAWGRLDERLHFARLHCSRAALENFRQLPQKMIVRGSPGRITQTNYFARLRKTRSIGCIHLTCTRSVQFIG